MARTLSIEILGNAAQFGRELDKAAGKTRRLGRVAGVAGAALGGLLVVGLEKSVRAAIGAEKSQTRLVQAFRNSHLSAQSYTKAIEASEKAGRKLGFTDEETKQSLGSLLTATGNVTKARKDLTQAYDIARFTGKSLTDSTKMLTMAMTGSQRAAKQLGITVQPVTKNFDALGKSATRAEKAHAKFLDKQATGEAVIEAVNKKLHGQSQAYADTAAGGMAKFHAETEHLEVQMGKKLLPTIEKVVIKLTDFINYLEGHPNAAKIFAAGVTILAGALLAAAAAQVALNLAVLANPYVLATVALLAYVAAIVLLWQRGKLARDVAAAMASELNPLIGITLLVKNHFSDLSVAVRKAATVIGAALSPVRVFGGALLGVNSAILSAIGKIASFIGSLGGHFKEVLTAALNPIDSVTSAIKTLAGWLRKAYGYVLDLIGALGRIHVPHFHLPSLPGLPKHLAGGGPLGAGEAAIVGEQGPEWFVPKRSGTIIPNGMAPAGGATYNFHFPNYVGSKRELVSMLRNAVREFERANGRPAFGA